MTIYILFTIAGVISTIGSIVTTIMILRELKKVKKRAQRVDSDINTLHKNQEVLMSTLTEIYRQIKKNEKTDNELKRKIRVVSAPRENE